METQQKKNITQSAPPVKLVEIRKTGWGRVEEIWDRIQVGRQGSYSIERLELLEHYSKTTSRTRVILVCMLTPLPVLVVAVLLECLPLKSPSEGWAANWVFWIRLSLMMFTLSIAGFSQINSFIPGFNLSISKMIIAALGICLAQSGTYLLEGAVFGFPVPFMWQLGAITMAVYAPAVTRLVFGAGLFQKGSVLWLHHERFQRCFFVLTGVYPLYKVLYDLIPRSYRGAVVIILPIWKFAAKQFVVHATRDLEDFIPELVAFSVDFFSALFLSVCMTTARSAYLSALFITADVFQSLLEFREMRVHARTLLRLLGDRQRTQEHLRSRNGSSLDTFKTAGLLTMILEVARNPNSYQITLLDGARLWASPSNVIPDKLYTRMRALGASGVYGPNGYPSNRAAIIPLKTKSRHQTKVWDVSVSVAPAPVTSSGQETFPMDARWTRLKRQGTSTGPRQAKRSKELVIQGLQLLFHCEYLALVEYIECVVPLVFVVYKSILEQLPNIAYYPEGGGNWSMNAVINPLVFSAMEIGSLVLLHIFLQRRFAFSPLYQLAFVLETQVYPVQANLFLETIFCFSISWSI
ncbi:unnamed protein product [Phytophthora lilii]|uniref:Unnamed protein product n=1 Tax=Phytophthora lilii TaxID=2077276 RepID=A0A9W6TII6_9STRA|nr:unnamed protein product [Phytophthora lilii]